MMSQFSLIDDRKTAAASPAFRTIGEVAKRLGVEQHVLRFWETQFPEITPMKLKGARRYYRPEDVELLERIKVLLYTQGFTIKGAKQALKKKRRGKLKFAKATVRISPERLPDSPAVQTLKNQLCPARQVVFELSDAQRATLKETRDRLAALHARLEAAG